MSTFINCPKCDDELEFEVTSDMQGDGCWARVVDFVDLVGQNCKCEFTDEEMEDCRDRAYQADAEREPNFSYEY